VLPREAFGVGVGNATGGNGTTVGGGEGGVQQQRWVPRTGPGVTIAVLPVTSTFDPATPTETSDGVTGQSGGGAGAGGQGGGGGGGSGGDGNDGESVGALQSRAELGAKVALPVLAAAAVEVGGFV
jgi:hypothetical protein